MTRKSQYGWMVVGGILCLCGGVVALKLREGNPANAQAERPAMAMRQAVETPPPPLPGSAEDKTADPAPANQVKPLPGPDEGAPPITPTEPPALPAKDAAPVNDPPPLPTVAAPPDLGPKDPPAVGKAEPPAPVAEGPPPAPPGPPAAPPEAAPPSEPPQPPATDIKEAKTPVPAPPVAPPTPREVTKLVHEPASEAWNDPKQSAPPGSIEPPPPAPRTLTRPDAVKVTPPVIVQVGEPPLAGAGPIQIYQVRNNGETIHDIARRTLGAGDRWVDVAKLNPSLNPKDSLSAGTAVHLPPDACLPTEEVEGLKPLPAMRPKSAAAKPKAVMALTGTYPCNIDDKRGITLPRAVREQFGDDDMLLVSPGPDQCLWLTDQAHQERLAERLEHSPAREIDVRVFKRLYYAQTERLVVGPEGRVAISDRLTAFAGLSQEVVLVGIDDHFEIWDAARWKQYTQAKSAAAPGAE